MVKQKFCPGRISWVAERQACRELDAGLEKIGNPAGRNFCEAVKLC